MRRTQAIGENGLIMNTPPANTVRPQDFENLLLVDLEATCWESNAGRESEMEAIDFGGVLVRMRDRSILKQFTIYVRPRVHPQLSDYCRNLTGISQATVEAGILFEQLAGELAGHLHDYQHSLAWASWGNYDRRQLEQDAARWGVATPLAELTHFNFKKLFAKRQRVRGSRPSIRRAIEIAGLQYEGAKHSGVDEARNIARLLPWVID